MVKLAIGSKIFFFWREKEVQPIASTSDNNSLLSDQDTN